MKIIHYWYHIDSNFAVKHFRRYKTSTRNHVVVLANLLEYCWVSKRGLQETHSIAIHEQEPICCRKFTVRAKGRVVHTYTSGGNRTKHTTSNPLVSLAMAQLWSALHTKYWLDFIWILLQTASGYHITRLIRVLIRVLTSCTTKN